METGLQFGSTSFGPRTNASEESSDDSTEAYREKVENLKDLIGNLNRQLNSEKIRAQAIDTVTNLLQVCPCLRPSRYMVEVLLAAIKQ